MTFLEVDSVVVTWWIVAFVPSGVIKGLCHPSVIHVIDIGLLRPMGTYSM